MRVRACATCLVMLAAAPSCGGSVSSGSTQVNGSGDAPGTAADGGEGAPEGGGTGGTTGAGGSGATDGGADAVYVDPGCPPPGRVPGIFECDPFGGALACFEGERCVPYVDYAGSCQTEEFGTRCVLAGIGVQGDDCAEEPCAVGYVCVTGGAGFVCAALCRIDGAKDDCPPGLVCSSLDVDGFHVCG